VHAVDVREGDRLRAASGVVTVRSTHDLGWLAKHTVYNLNVGNAHTFVANGILVHNCNGNSYEYMGPTHVYEIRYKGVSGRAGVYKYGKGSKIRKRDGKSARAERQVRKLNRDGDLYESRIVKHHVSTKAARMDETRRIKRYTGWMGRRPFGNMADW